MTSNPGLKLESLAYTPIDHHTSTTIYINDDFDKLFTKTDKCVPYLAGYPTYKEKIKQRPGGKPEGMWNFFLVSKARRCLLCLLRNCKF